MKRITAFILFYNSSGASVVVSIERIADRSGSTADGETESSSMPIDRKVSISSASAPSSPQMPIQIPAEKLQTLYHTVPSYCQPSMS